MTSDNINVRFNGYKGKRFWDGASDITVEHVYDGNVSMIYYNQTDAAYKNTSWTTRTETWTSADLVVPPGATIRGAWLYISYNWGDNAGVPDFGVNFNGNTAILNSMYGHYTDYSNLGTYGSKKYGLISVDVTSDYIPNGNNYLTMTRNGNVQALYPSTLVVVYEDTANITHQARILVNEGADYLLVNPTRYGTTMDETIAYEPNMTLTTAGVDSAYVYSFVASAGPDEGNLYFNDLDNPVASLAWQGNSYSTYPVIANVTALLQANNTLAVQGTSTGGMFVIEQILVVDYNY